MFCTDAPILDLLGRMHEGETEIGVDCNNHSGNRTPDKEHYGAQVGAITKDLDINLPPICAETRSGLVVAFLGLRQTKPVS